jgi:Domain of unknown function (DUF4352)
MFFRATLTAAAIATAGTSVALLRLLATFLAAVLLLTGCSMDASGQQSQPSNSPSSAKIGQPVRDGKFEFVVTKVDNDGGVVRARLTVKNIGNESQLFSSTDQKLVIGGKKFASNLMESSGATSEDLNPGLGADAVVAFDVPPGAVPDAIELHDSMFSFGVKVSLQ